MEEDIGKVDAVWDDGLGNVDDGLGNVDDGLGNVDDGYGFDRY